VENTVPVESDRTIVMSLAYCLARDGLSPIVTVETKSKTVQIGQQTGGAALRVECPPDGALTGGGFRIAGDLDSLDASFNAGLQSSRPDPGGWNLDMGQWIHNTGGQREYSAYAVCTSSPIQRGQILEASFNFNTDPHDGHSLVTFAARCTNPNSFTTAGGFDLKGDNTDAHRAWSSNSRNEFSEWRVDLDTNKMTADPPSAVTLCTPKCRSNVACVVTPPAASQ
jgi:hypothetical protein